MIIAALASRKIVTKLSLAHTRLGPDGFKELFDYLCSKDGKRYGINEMDFHSCGMDDAGLRSLAEYLRCNRILHTLQLQQVSLPLFLITTRPTLTLLDRMKLGKTKNLSSTS